MCKKYKENTRNQFSSCALHQNIWNFNDNSEVEIYYIRIYEIGNVANTISYVWAIHAHGNKQTDKKIAECSNLVV